MAANKPAATTAAPLRTPRSPRSQPRAVVSSVHSCAPPDLVHLPYPDSSELVRMSTSMAFQNLPVAVVGAGPIGLAAAAHLLARDERPIVFEAGAQVGAAIREWGHVRLFSPWRYLV